MQSPSVLSAPAYERVAPLSAGVGLLIDRCVRSEQAIGTTWLAAPDTAVTCAHLVVLYQDFLRALKVHFPASSQTFEVESVSFHPRFDRQVAADMAMRSLAEPVAALPLQDYNLAFLKLSRSVSHLNREEATSFNKRLSLAPMPRIKGMAGAVEEIGLALVVQTVANTRKDGVLFITDERNRPLSRLFFKDGKIAYARYRNLSNEMAVFQLFQENIAGQFQFRSQSEPDWKAAEPMSRTTDGLLLEAHRRLDETPKLLEQLGGGAVAFTRVSGLLDTGVLPPDVVPAAERLWPHLDGGISADQLFDVVNMDSFTVLSALVELAFSRQAAPVTLESQADFPKQPLETAAWELLCPWDEIVSLTVHPASGRPQMRTGSLVGLLRPNDPYHMLHTLSLPYKAAGSPILKAGKIIGMHLGRLPLDPTLHALPSHLNQMLWVDALSALGSTQGKRSGANKKSVGMQRPQPELVCPKCQSAMVKEAKFCGVCGSKLG